MGEPINTIAWAKSIGVVKMAKRMTSEIITVLQKVVEKHGDLPFVVCDNDNGICYEDVTVFANAHENGGCGEDDTPVVGISF